MAAQQNEPSARAQAKAIVLMTGVNGFLGRALSEVLAREYQVVGLDRKGACPPAVDCVVCDITSDASVEQALQQVRERHGARIASVVHLAGYFDFSGEPNPLYQAVNVEGTRRLLQHLQGLQVEQFIYASTMLVHAPTEPGVAISETSPLEPKWAYPQSKRQTEQVVEQQHGAIPYVLLRVAGVYTERILPPTLAQQTRWIYERQFNSRVFPGDISHGQSFLHIDDLLDGLQRLIVRRAALPAELALLLGEPASLSYEALQNQMGMLIHGELWDTDTLPKPLAKLGARLRQKMEPMVPDAIDFGETPFVKPFMVELAADHYELDIARARQLLAWEPRHALRDMLPKIVERLRAESLDWYRDNKITPPEWLQTLAEQSRPADRLLEDYDGELRQQHRDSLWAHFLNMGVGAWLLSSPAILGYNEPALIASDMVAGVLVMLFSALSLSRRLIWARVATAMVGLWLLLAPLALWTPSAAAYLNGTLLGFLVIALAMLVRPVPGIGVAAAMTGPDIPPGWDFSPSSWLQRIPIIVLAFIGLFISRYLAAFQLGHIDAAWDPFFRDGSERVITSEVSQAWPVPDAGLGALVYVLEILTGIIGGRARWRTMPWLVLLFGMLIVPLGAVSIFFIIIQPIVIGTWCTLCLVAAAAMLIQIPYSMDELVACFQFLRERRRQGKSVLLAILRGDTLAGGRKSGPDDFERPPLQVVREMLGGGVNLPWSLALSMALGVWLMCTRLIFGTEGAQADSDHLIGALVITVAVSAMAETIRPARFLNLMLAVALMFAPWMFDGGSLLADLAGVAAGILLVLLTLPRGRIVGHYGGWNRFLV
jgi:nucleoside-diphosphate-sugar epimerase/uncharacterized membrane protein